MALPRSGRQRISATAARSRIGDPGAVLRSRRRCDTNRSGAQPLPALASTSVHNRPACARGHAMAEAVPASTSAGVGLVRALHADTLLAISVAGIPRTAAARGLALAPLAPGDPWATTAYELRCATLTCTARNERGARSSGAVRHGPRATRQASRAVQQVAWHGSTESCAQGFSSALRSVPDSHGQPRRVADWCVCNERLQQGRRGHRFPPLESVESTAAHDAASAVPEGSKPKRSTWQTLRTPVLLHHGCRRNRWSINLADHRFPNLARLTRRTAAIGAAQTRLLRTGPLRAHMRSATA